jgi:hypothetical protein
LKNSPNARPDFLCESSKPQSELLGRGDYFTMPQLECIAPGFAPHVWIALEWSSPAKLIVERTRDVIVFERCIIIVPTENAKLCEAAEFFVLDKMRERNRAIVFFYRRRK